ncbi:MAG: preprotein translocase subunit SecG [SAR202 cluster bacterium Io17-Chloro-G2]|nr:MAG: preprotein translocase subunit SecG [SAR202 cluster bacterium Io17-Chloro-G2]
MGTYLNIIQILVSLMILVVILSQVKEGGGGLFGSGQSSIKTRRGLEKTLFQFTIFLVGLFLLVSIVSVRFG